ncbi:MAG: hypothetical protein KIS92_25215 [Planctomycetota bacterium]|nr:hypothetical protein [Planctomycetota bacterium]
MGNRLYSNYVQKQRAEQRGQVLGVMFAVLCFLGFALGVLFGKRPFDQLPPVWQWVCALVWGGLLVDGMLWIYVRKLGWPVVRLENLLILFLQSAVAGFLCVQAQMVDVNSSRLGSALPELIFLQTSFFLTSILIVHAGLQRYPEPSPLRRMVILYLAPPLSFSSAACVLSWLLESGGITYFVMGFPACGMTALVVLSFCEMIAGFFKRPRARTGRTGAQQSSHVKR